ncbi:hypothetical protein ACWDSL_42000 [Streptomyces sp. NPDC000941]
MATIAVTGHMDISEDSVPLVREELARVLAAYDPSTLVGVSCIARGSDSLFADAVLAVGGRLDAADEVLVMPHATANCEAYEAANAVLLERADRLVAVWNGQPPTGKGGGMADVVYEAREADLPVDVVWPDGASRQA